MAVSVWQNVLADAQRHTPTVTHSEMVSLRRDGTHGSILADGIDAVCSEQFKSFLGTPTENLGTCHHNTWEDYYLPPASELRVNDLHPKTRALIEKHGEFDEQGGDKWLQDRQKYSVTASNIGRVTGTWPRCLPVEKYAAIRAGLEKEEELPAYVREVIMQHGTDNEERAIALTLKHVYKGRGQIILFGLIPHPDPKYSFLAGSVDGVWDPNPPGVEEKDRLPPRIIEVKAPFRRRFRGGDAPPPQYYDQMQGLMEILDIDACDFIQLKTDGLIGIPNDRKAEADFLDVVTVQRDPSWWSAVAPALVNFDNQVKRLRENKRQRELTDVGGPADASV